MAFNPGMASTSTPGETGELDPSLLDAELRARRWHLGFAPAVEARYEADTALDRIQQMLLAGFIGLLVYDLFLVNDAMARPEVFSAALLWRVGVLTPYGLLVLALVRRGLPPLWREAAMASTIVVAMLASGMIFWHTTTPVGVYDPFVFGLIFLAGNIAHGLRWAASLCSTVLSLGIGVGFVVASPLMPPDAREFAIALMVGTAVFTLLASYRIERGLREAYLLRLREQLRSEAASRSAQEFAAISRTDALTRLANRRAFDVELSRRWLELHMHQRPLAALLIDIDHFKRYNDRFGHPAGDVCLRRVAEAMRNSVRDTDFIARTGGEEFVVLLQGASLEAVQAAAERIRRNVEAMGLPHDGRLGQRVVTISLGVALADPHTELDERGLVQAADIALYEAKHQGRNRWVMAGHDGGTPHPEVDEQPAALAI